MQADEDADIGFFRDLEQTAKRLSLSCDGASAARLRRLLLDARDVVRSSDVTLPAGGHRE